MTFLEIMVEVAKNAGIAAPSSVTGTDADSIKLSQFINEAGREIARRVDWSVLRKTASLSMTGMDAEYTIASDFDRLSQGLSVICSPYLIRGSLTPDEWAGLTPTKGDPRYFYLKAGKIAFYPYPNSGETVKVMYQSNRWVSEEATNGFDRMTKNNQESLLNGDLVASGATWRWRRHIGKDYADYLSEFEAMLTDLAKADGGERAP